MNLKRMALFGVGIALIFAVINSFGLEQTAAALVRTNLGLLGLAAVLELAIIFLFILRLKVLVSGRGYVSFSQMFRISMSGMFISMITPLAKLGGEPLKMYMMRGNVGSHNASAAVAIESLMELLSSLLMIFLVAALLFSQIPPAFVTSLVIFLVVIGFVMGLLLKIFFTPHWLHKIVNWLSVKMARLVEAEKKDYAKVFSTAFYDMIRNKRRVYLTFLLSIGMKLLEMLRLWIVFLALGIFLPFSFAVIIWAIILILMFIPWLPGSLGLVEFGGISAIIAFGVSPAGAASTVVLERLVSFWLPLAIGLVAFTAAKRRGELPDILKRKQPAKPRPVSAKPHPVQKLKVK